jgi:TfoX/Sxy family transcriptional regulator of competence genes
MAYDEELAGRVRSAVSGDLSIRELSMFGGLCYLVDGNMCFGVVDERLMVRVGAEAHAAALLEPHVAEMDLSGRSMRGFVLVSPGGLETEEELAAWLKRGADFAGSLPPK